MPVYTYECSNGHLFDAQQPITAPPLTTCERCAAPVHRIIYAPTLSFQGEGWCSHVPQ